MSDWKQYYKKQEKREPREQLVRAVFLCRKRIHALDLGSGNFVEAKYLAKRFQLVTAIDSSKDAQKYTKNLNKKINFLNLPFNEVDFSQYGFGLINAQYALPFYGRKGFNSFIENLKNSLRKAGIFVGQFFGNKDSFKDRKNLVFHTKKQVVALLSPFKVLEFIEEERDGEIITGEKRHWHVFHFIARK